MGAPLFQIYFCAPLDFTGDGFLQVAVSTDVEGGIDMSGTINAGGGKVIARMGDMVEVTRAR